MTKLPLNWIKCQIGEVTQIVGGSTPPSTDPTNFTIEGGIPWITPADLSGYKSVFISHGGRNLTDKGLRLCSAKIIPAGSVLFSSRAPVGYVAIAANELSTNQGFKSFILPRELDNRYIYYYLRHIKPIAEKMATGTTFKELSGSNSARLPLIIAPFNEQKRIAERLDILLSRAESCLDHLDSVPEILNRFRQAVIAAAVSGKLTEKWRSENNISFIWVKVKLSEVATSRLGKMLDAAKNTGELKPYLRNINVRWFGFDLTDIQHIRLTEEEFMTLSVCKGDVLVCEGGEPGRSAVWYGENDYYVFQKALHRIRVGEKLTSEWICFCLKASSDSGELQDYFTGTTIKHFTGVALSQFTFDLPTLEEQHEIIRRVEKLFTLADNLDVRYQAANGLLDNLIPALLSKAFRGELVPQDPIDEPASMLLERIKISRQNAPKEIKKPQRRIGMEILTQKAKNQRVGIVQALLEAKKELSTEQLFYFAGYPNDAGAELIEDFFVDIRDALKDRKIKKRRDNNADWFSLVTQ